MVYNDMIPVDTFDSTGTETNFCGPFSQESGLYDQFESSYDTPALPGGGGSTAPSLPIGFTGTSQGSGSNVPSSPLPGLGGSGYQQQASSGGFGQNIQQWLNPQTIGAGLGILSSVAGQVGANRSPDKSTIKAVCGRKPLLNIGGKKDRYQQCAQGVFQQKYQQQQALQQQPTGMSSSTKIILGVVAFLVIVAIIITIIMVMKRGNANTTATAK